MCLASHADTDISGCRSNNQKGCSQIQPFIQHIYADYFWLYTSQCMCDYIYIYIYILNSRTVTKIGAIICLRLTAIYLDGGGCLLLLYIDNEQCYFMGKLRWVHPAIAAVLCWIALNYSGIQQFNYSTIQAIEMQRRIRTCPAYFMAIKAAPQLWVLLHLPVSNGILTNDEFPMANYRAKWHNEV